MCGVVKNGVVSTLEDLNSYFSVWFRPYLTSVSGVERSGLADSSISFRRSLESWIKWKLVFFLTLEGLRTEYRSILRIHCGLLLPRRQTLFGW